MIIARASKPDGSTLYMLGLTRDNFQRMEKGEPILLDEKHPAMIGGGVPLPPGSSLILFFGETEKEIYKMCKEGGMIGPDTITHGVPDQP